LLRRLDNATMLCAVEARVPFVDHHPLIERMAGVPFGYRMKDGEVKSPLKRVFQDLVPPTIIQRKKVGFPVPLESIPFGESMAPTPMDQWLEFNLSELCGTRVTAAE
ncbi:MAG: asparagine synthase-related protein, partial [Candidatus Subteraquimicrobiales bacterium]|nr:asparagine synthase-related protein [Candidatus Subteraquimicrobiales bacterium]